MSHLLAIAVGPVQEFIAAARRTRDLWFGSQLLSKISREVAEAVQAAGGELIFPQSINAPNVANVILAELPAGAPKAVADQAKQAARKYWEKVAEEVQKEAEGVIRKDVWKDQVEDVIEFYAAWVPDSGNYSQDRKKLMRLLAGRKNCRDFLPANGIDVGLPKSSLDGQRATVLIGPKEGESPEKYRNSWPKKIRRKLRVRSGEQLDVVGIVKRIGEDNVPFASVSRLAADVWIRGIDARGGKQILDVFRKQIENLPADVIHRLDTETFPQFKLLPYEGTTLFRSRHHEWWQETEDAPEKEEKRQPPEWYGEFSTGLQAVEKYAKENGIGLEPNPYLAVLVADGDRMGEALSELKTAEANRGFSKILAGFATDAEKIVSKHNGVLVYAGGDDVLAFLPVDKCLCCARELRDGFVETLKDYPNKDGISPTLSAGIAIGHFMENLEDLLEYGRAAEKAAKKVKGKDALAVHLHKRGGSPVSVSSPWKHRPEEALTRYAGWMLAEVIPGKLPYELRKLAELYEDWPAETDVEKEKMKLAVQKDVLRVIRDKQPKGGKETMQKIEKLIAERLNAEPTAEGKSKASVILNRFSEELLVAKQIAVAMKQAGDDKQEQIQ